MKILVSQNAPTNLSAYTSLTEKYGAEFDFKPFFVIEPLTDREFRAQRITLQDYTAVVFSSRHAIDAYFQLCEQTRFKVPDTMKYFCTTELVAMYLQKHIVYRKRKIFFGTGTPESVAALITPKHKGERFLIASTEGTNPTAITSRFDEARINYTVAALVKPVSQDLSGIDFSRYGLCVLYNPCDVKALFENHPDFTPGEMKFVSFGKSIVKSMEAAGLKAEIQGPTPEVPSAAKAIELFLSSL